MRTPVFGSLKDDDDGNPNMPDTHTDVVVTSERPSPWDLSTLEKQMDMQRKVNEGVGKSKLDVDADGRSEV